MAGERRRAERTHAKTYRAGTIEIAAKQKHTGRGLLRSPRNVMISSSKHAECWRHTQQTCLQHATNVLTKKNAGRGLLWSPPNVMMFLSPL